VGKSGIHSSDIKGIGFDATCSMVLCGHNGEPVRPSASDSDGDSDVIMWMDHRAHAETDLINGTNHPALQSCGGRVSIEMQIPKLLWLKRV
jgi:D-ribulokinase